MPMLPCISNSAASHSQCKPEPSQEVRSLNKGVLHNEAGTENRRLGGPLFFIFPQLSLGQDA